MVVFGLNPGRSRATGPRQDMAFRVAPIAEADHDLVSVPLHCLLVHFAVSKITQEETQARKG